MKRGNELGTVKIKQVKSQLDDLNQMLVKEVNAIVDSNAATINAAHAELLKTQAVAEAKISADKASEEAIKAKKLKKKRKWTSFLMMS